MGLPQGYTQHRAGVTRGEPRGVHADGLGLGKAPTVPDGGCKFRVRKVADTVSVAPMGGAVDLAISVAIVVPALAGLLCALEWYAGLWRAAV